MSILARRVRVLNQLLPRLYSSTSKKSTTGSSDDQIAKTPEKTTQLTHAPDKELTENTTDKSEMRWRTPWHEKEGQYYSTLRTFYSESNNLNVLQLLHADYDFSPSGIKKWLTKRRVEKEAFMQSYLPERNEALGDELAAAHFIVHRGGSVKFHNDDKWIKANDLNEYSLPRFYNKDYHLQAIDCADMELYYEGLANFKGLQKLEWLNLSGCQNMDDWCMDRVSGLLRNSLVYLDLRDCPRITHRGIGALYRLRNLKILLLDDFLRNTTYELTCLMLQEANPKLDIRSEEE